MQPTIVFERMVMLPSPCEVTLTVETLEPETQIHSCHQLAAQRIADDSFSWPEGVRFEVKSTSLIVIKVQVKPKSGGWTAWLSNPSFACQAKTFHASTKRLKIQDLQAASFDPGAEHFSFDLLDAVSARVVGAVILKSPLSFENTMIKAYPAYPAGQTIPSIPEYGPIKSYGASMAPLASMTPLRGGMSQNPSQR